MNINVTKLHLRIRVETSIKITRIVIILAYLAESILFR